MTKAQQALAAAHVAWARRHQPHLLTPWLDEREREVDIATCQRCGAYWESSRKFCPCGGEIL